MTSEPLSLEKFYSFGTTPLRDLLRDDTGCFRAFSSLMNETGLLVEGDGQGSIVNEPREIFQVTSGEVRGDISVITQDLEIPAQVHSGFSDAITSALATDESREDETMIPEVSLSGDVMPPQNTQSRAFISFPLSEVRQNAFFFVVSRGGMVMDQPGNKRLRRIINMHAQVYIHARRVDRGALKRQVFELCRWQFEFVIQKQAFMRSYNRHLQQEGGRHLSGDRIRSILEANGGVKPIICCDDTDFLRVGEECAFDVVGHLLRDAANDLRRSQRGDQKKNSK
eukprot:scaffold19336_cov199-Amphora_coffeaeformis.AAC.3